MALLSKCSSYMVIEILLLTFNKSFIATDKATIIVVVIAEGHLCIINFPTTEINSQLYWKLQNL